MNQMGEHAHRFLRCILIKNAICDLIVHILAVIGDAGRAVYMIRIRVADVGYGLGRTVKPCHCQHTETCH